MCARVCVYVCRYVRRTSHKLCGLCRPPRVVTVRSNCFTGRTKNEDDSWHLQWHDPMAADLGPLPEWHERDWKLRDLLGRHPPREAAAGADAEGSHRSSFTTERGAERGHAFYEGYGMHNAPVDEKDDPFLKKEFGRAMLKDLLTETLVTHDEEQVHRLLKALGHAMEARDAYATTQLWDKVVGDVFKIELVSNDKWAIYGSDAKWPQVDVSLIDFLALRVRRPRLLMAVVGPRLASRGGGITRTPGVGTKEGATNGAIRKGVPAIIAAILSDVFYVRRTGNGYDADLACDDERWRRRTADTYEGTAGLARSPETVAACKDDWLAVVRLLASCTRRQPYPQSLFCAYADCGHTRYVPVTLLDVAVLASERTWEPLRAVLEDTAWLRNELLRAFRYALKTGVLRGGTFGDVTHALYDRLVRMDGHRWLSAAWCDVYRYASWWFETDTLDLGAQPGVNLPAAFEDDAQSPTAYVQLMRRMYGCHKVVLGPSEEGVDHWPTEQRLCIAWAAVLARALSPKAANQAAECVAKPELLLTLLDLFKEAKVLNSLASSEQILSKAPYQFWNCYQDILLAFYDDEDRLLLPEHYEVAHTALHMVVFNGSRGAYRCLINALTEHADLNARNRVALGKSLVGKAHVMDAFVRKLCDLEAHVPTELWRHAMSEEAREHVRKDVRDDLVKWLEAGDWTEAHLHTALVAASEVRSAIAVQVLISPPYNTPLLKDDPFVCAVVDAVYAPDAPIAQTTGAQWGKRPREEAEAEAEAGRGGGGGGGGVKMARGGGEGGGGGGLVAR